MTEGLALLLQTLVGSAARQGPLASPLLVSAVGADDAGAALLKHCESLGWAPRTARATMLLSAACVEQ